MSIIRRVPTTYGASSVETLLIVVARLVEEIQSGN